MSVLDALHAPRGWRSVPFGRAATRTKESGRPDLPPLSVFLGAGVVPRDSREDNHNQLGEDLGKYLVVRPGDLVFNKLRTWQGGLGASEHEGIVSPAYFVCRPTPDYDSRFLQYLLLSDAYLQELTRVSKWQPPSQFDIGWEQLRAVPIVSPDVPAQRAIADYLDTETARIDALIAKKQRMIELLEERLQTAIRDRLSNLSAPVLPLKRAWRVIDCKHRTPSYVDEGFPVVSPGDVSPGRLDLSRATRFVSVEDLDDLTDGPRRPRRGDIIYSRNASIGTAAYVDTDDRFCMGQDVCLVTSAGHDQLFLTYVLNTVGLDQLDVQKIGSTFSRVNISQIVELLVPVPSRSEQEELAGDFDRMSAQSRLAQAKLQDQIVLLREHRQALITAAVTGELEIPGVAA